MVPESNVAQSVRMIQHNGEVHPVADLFPMMSVEELNELAADIAANGLNNPVVLLPDGTLLDGRNRLEACSRAGLPPQIRIYDGSDPIGFVMSENLQRRHLTAGQRAMLALEVLPHIESEVQVGRPPKTTEIVADLPQFPEKSRERAAKVVGASGRAVSQAKRVSEAAPDLAQRVRAGELPIDRAERIVRDRASEAKRIEKAAATVAHITFGTSIDIRHGDFRDVLADLENVDAIITDPPYPGEFLPLLDDLAHWADKVLAPNGVLVVLFGQTYLPEVFRRLDGHRPYRWTGAYMTPGAGYSSMPRRVQSNWKPVLVYGGGERFADVFRSEGSDSMAKDLHYWGQDYGAFHQIVERMTLPGQTVVDPFMGSGTTLLAARALGRNAIGCDLDEHHVETTRRRLA